MSTKIKFAAALTALTLAATFAMPSKEAEARRWGGGGLAVGLIGGALVGAAIASSANANTVYFDGYRRCRWAPVRLIGFYVGTTRVCNY